MLSSGLNGVDMSTNQQGAYGQANKDIAGAQGKSAYDVLSRLNAELNNKTAQYTVNSGDSLWSISGQSGIYGNPYQWPLIYKANSDKIKDADLIYPGQDLSVNMNPSSDDVNAAVEHAKTRGAWTLGDTESSDDDYLSGTLHVK
ncbi:MAG: LysM peptidoglycan-binding domain-containing protein [Gammaproteobacteria bacterium]|nr:LysM peptidoglycan-binding domain-containing protein [Gammaproteobacteria bacterium]